MRSFEYEIEDTFAITGRGTVVMVKGSDEFNLNSKFLVHVKNAEGKVVFEDTATQEFARKLGKDGAVESIFFLFTVALKKDIPLDGTIVVFP